MRRLLRSARLLLLVGGFGGSLVVCAQPDVRFIENKNQWNASVDFASGIPGGKMFVGAGFFRYYFLDYGNIEDLHHAGHKPDPDAYSDQRVRGHAVFVDFVSADARARAEPFGRSSAYYNYFLGSDPAKWASGAYGYEGMLYPCLYPDIDLKVYAAGQHVKYEFFIAPDADPSQIRMRYQGSTDIFLDNGNLYIKTSLADIVENQPIAYQLIDGERVPVSCAFELRGNEVSFLFPEGYDPCHMLVVDPLLIFSTYSGSTADNWGSTATPGEHGNLYSAGVTQEQDDDKFPATPGAFQTSSVGLFDIGILKYDSLGSQLLYATYLGGSECESPHSLVMNGQGELLMLGTTSSANFATTENAFDRTFNGGPPISWVVGYPYNAGSDMVISRFSADGKTLLASTFVGGTHNDGLNPMQSELSRNYGDQLRGDIITDEAGNVYISSVTSSADFPVVNGFGASYGGGTTDAVLLKMDPDLSEVLWGVYVGGSGTDAAHTIKLDSLNDIFVAGGTTSADFPLSADAYQTSYLGQVDGWIAKVASDGTAILRSTLTGTADYNQIYFLDLNQNGEVYVYGQTTGIFPITGGVYNDPGSGQFVQKFGHDLDTLHFSTVFGAGRGIPDISPTAFLVNECNNLYMAGWGGRINSLLGFWDSGTDGMPVTPDAFQQTTSGSDFYFIVLTEDARERLYATFLGGTESRTHVDGGTSRFDKGGIVYHSVCSGCAVDNATGESTSDFPTTAGVWSQVNASANCNNAAFKFDLSSLKARLRTNSETRDMPGIQVVCIPDAFVFENVSIGGEIFEWDLGDGTAITTTDTAAFQHAYQAPGKYRVKLVAYDRGTCKAVDSTSTTVTVNIAQSSVQDDADVCFGEAYTLQADGAATYSWTNNVDSTFHSTEAHPVVSPRDTTVYFVRLTEVNGCVRKDTVQLNVVPGIKPEFEWSRQPECVARPGITVSNLTDSLNSEDLLFFDFGDGTTSDNPAVEHNFEKDGVYNVRLVTQREFCVYEKSVAIPVFEMYIPNVITPGQPEHNDVFTIRYGQQDGVTPGDFGYRVSLVIYNRWGRMLYETDDYQYDWSGEGLAAGIYYYEVTVEGHGTCKSWLHLLP